MDGKYTQIGKSIVVFEVKHDANLTCVELEESLVFIDTGRRYDVASNFRKEMENRFGKKASHLFITHYHFDHYGGVAAFKDVNIVAAEAGYNQFIVDLNFNLTKEKRQTYVEKWKEEVNNNETEILESTKIHWEYFPKAELFPPNIKVKEEFVYSEGDNKVIFRVQGGHSKCSAQIILPKEQTIHVGDNLAMDPERGNEGSKGYMMKFFRFGVSADSIKALKISTNKNFETIIPGHGPPTNKHTVLQIIDYFDELMSIIKAKYEEEYQEEDYGNFKDDLLDNWDDILKQQIKTIKKGFTIKNLEQKKALMLKSMIENNLDTYFDIYSSDLEFSLPNGFCAKGRENIRDNFLGFDEIIDHRFDCNRYYFFEDKIIEYGQYCAKFDNGRDLKNYEKKYVFFWYKKGREWKIGNDITISEQVN